MVTRDEVRRIAEQALASYRELDDGAAVVEILSGDELGERRISPYTASPISWENSWVVYVARKRVMLMSSLIIIISKTDGRIVYAGPVNDEG
tara:strand:- start:1294 stop:1569 length:276 start_codon:yes stop_codon:yes gene_type:complete